MIVNDHGMICQKIINVNFSWFTVAFAAAVNLRFSPV